MLKPAVYNIPNLLQRHRHLNCICPNSRQSARQEKIARASSRMLWKFGCNAHGFLLILQINILPNGVFFNKSGKTYTLNESRSGISCTTVIQNIECRLTKLRLCHVETLVWLRDNQKPKEYHLSNKKQLKDGKTSGHNFSSGNSTGN